LSLSAGTRSTRNFWVSVTTAGCSSVAASAAMSFPKLKRTSPCACCSAMYLGSGDFGGVQRLLTFSGTTGINMGRNVERCLLLSLGQKFIKVLMDVLIVKLDVGAGCVNCPALNLLRRVTPNGTLVYGREPKG